MEILKLEKVSKFYKSIETVSVGMKDVTASFEIGEFVAITGESGSGKSTLLNVISGLDGYEEGEVYHYGEETSHYTIADWEKYRSAYIGFVFQNYNIIDSYTVYQNVLFALEVQGYPEKNRRARALELIEKVGLTSHKYHKASKLSGGQKQRAVIARALAKDTPIIVADEPTGNLDSESAKQIMALLHELSNDKLVIVVTHDYSQVEQYVTRKIKMHDGTIVEDLKIKEHEVKTEQVKAEVKKTSFKTLLRVSLRNVFSMPKRFLFMLLLQILVIGIFTIVYSGEMLTIRETGIEQSYIYPNVPKTRLLIERRDGQLITSAEIESFKKNKNVIDVYENTTLFYNTEALSIKKIGDPYSRFIAGTDSAVVLSKSDVKGELPKEIDEIVISSYYGDFKIGDIVKISTTGDRNYEDGAYIPPGEFKVVGIDKKESFIVYFSEKYFKEGEHLLEQRKQMLKEFFKTIIVDSIRVSFLNGSDNFKEYYSVLYQENSVIHYDLQTVIETPIEAFDIYLGNAIFWGYFENKTFQLPAKQVNVGYIDNQRIYYLFITEELFTEVIDDLSSIYYNGLNDNEKNFISVEVDGFNSGDKFMKSVNQNIYKVYYPANISYEGSDILLFFTKIFSFILLFFMGMFLYTIVHAVSKNVMASRKKDFAIYRSIGTNQKTIAIMVVLEQIIINMIGFIIAIIGLNILARNFNSIGKAIPYMTIKDYIILVGIFLFFSIWLGLRFNKKVFNQSVIEVLTLSQGDL